MKAFLKQVRISPKKVSLAAKLVRGKSVSEALTLLSFIPKRSAPVLKKLIESAAANAENNFKQKKDGLTISSIVVNAGTTMKRGRPVSRGRWHPIKKRTSHVSVELSAAAPAKTEKKAPAKKVATEKAAPEKAKEAPVKKEASKKTEEKAAIKESTK